MDVEGRVGHHMLMVWSGPHRASIHDLIALKRCNWVYSSLPLIARACRSVARKVRIRFLGDDSCVQAKID